MKTILKLFVLCFVLISGTAFGQMYGDFRSYQTGNWNMTSTWEEWGGITWVAATRVPSSAEHSVVIWGGHVVTVSSGATASVSYLTIHAGQLIIESGATFTVQNEVIIDDINALFSVGGTLINNGSIKLQQGGFGLGTLINNGSVDVAGIFNVGPGTITGNDLTYLPGATIDFYNSSQSYEDLNIVWPTVSGPTNVTIRGRFNLNGIRTITGNLNVYGTLQVNGELTVDGTTNATMPLRVAGTYTNNGTADIKDSLIISGAYINNGTTNVTGMIRINDGGSAVGNRFVYTGSSNKLLFYGSSHVDGTVFGAGATAPKTVTMNYNSDVTLDASVTVNVPFEIYGNLQVTDSLTIGGSTWVAGNIDVLGIFVNNLNLVFYNPGAGMQVDGTFINNGTTQNNGTVGITGTMINSGLTQINGILQVGGTLINNDSTEISGTFQLDQGGSVTGNVLAYNYGYLIFNNTLGSYNVDSGILFWPDSDGPLSVYVQGAGGITMNVPRTVDYLQTAAHITNANNLTISNSVEINAGGLFDSSPTYIGDASLSYNTGGPYNAGYEWIGGNSVGAGVPLNIQINSGTILNMPNTPRTCIGDISIYGTLVLNTTPGADLTVGGNWNGYFENSLSLISNSRIVTFNGTAEQIIRGIVTFDHLIINNPAGITIPGYIGEGQQIDSVTVSKTFTLAAGNIRLGQNWNSILTTGDSLIGFSAGNYIVTYPMGRVVHTIAGGGSFQFPIGPNETSYNPVTIALHPSDPAGTFNVHVDSTLNDTLFIQRSWYIIEEGAQGDNHAALTFQWSGADEGKDFNRSMTSTYYYDDNTAEYTEFSNGAVSGTDPYIVSTSGGFPCTNFASSFGNSSFIVGTSGAMTAVDGSKKDIPTAFMLSQNYPNPFNPSTTISYQLPNTADITLKIYDVLGREVATLAHGVKEAGSYSVTFNADKLSSGIYITRLTAQPQNEKSNGSKSFIQTKKMLLVK